MDDHRLDAWRERPLNVLSRVTAENRGWIGLSASLIDIAGGAGEVAFPQHNVLMLVGTPLNTAMCCDGAGVSRLQQPGTFDIVPARSTISFVDAGRSLFFAVGLEHSLVCETAHSMGMNGDRVTLEHRLTCRDPQIEHLMLALRAELELDQPCGRVYADSLGVALASQLLRRWGKFTPKQLTRGLPRPTLQRVLAYIDDRLSADLNLSSIAEIAGMSSSHFGTLFRNSLGMPVHRYIIRRRVERAVDLITRTHLPLSDIALQVGFANQSHMAMAVRRLTGVTPKYLRSES
ncbi:MAG TPA: AraC family transcriptional regulator [Candidatus Aquilonibacter sp.]